MVLVTLPKASNDMKFRIQKIGIVLAPPLTACVCLLAGLDIFYVALFAIAVAFPASLYNRRLYVYTEENMSEGKQDLGMELLENRPNVVAYKNHNGTQIIGVYKIAQKPQRQFLHTLNSTVANYNLAMSFIENANGTFLVIRFPGKGYKNPRRLIRDAVEHLETLSGIITQDAPGLKVEPASLEELRSLTGLLGLAIAKKPNHQVSKELDDIDLTSNQRRKKLPDFQLVKEALRESLPLSEYCYPGIEESPPEIHEEAAQSRESTNTRAEVNEEAQVRTMDENSQANSLILKIDEASETRESVRLNLSAKIKNKSKYEQSFTQEETQAIDSGVTSIPDEKTLLGLPRPNETLQRSFDQFKKDLKPKKLALEHYTCEKVRKNCQNSRESSPVFSSSMIAREPSGNSSQENEKRTVEPRQSIAQLADNRCFAKDNGKIIAKLKELHCSVAPTVEGLAGDENDIVLSQTGKRIAGRLVVKDLIEILEIADDLKGCPAHIKGIIAGFRQYIVEQLWMSIEENMDPGELWNRIPGAVKIVDALLKNLNELLPAYSEQQHHHQEERTSQPT
ncbi:MAG: hypothetical protein ACFFB3_12935 [Candidatus Hodarchaeota archaeon]